ncbi:unnamed protein product [Brachionus calyciflorus]|uniref:Homeobox domain-containing protein n=1 Tax=Brachionus calyciflorus TaxID=104777 RepID=A0A813QG93_9BILA|nr:unnamed protein product [Brachionus calyciflorus]
MQNNFYDIRMREFRMNYMNRPNNESESENSYPSISISRSRDSISPLGYTESFNDNNESYSSNNCHQVSPKSDNINYLIPSYSHGQYDSGFYQNNSVITSSPFLAPIQNTLQNRLLNNVKKSIQFQSTPNKSFNKPDSSLGNFSGIETTDKIKKSKVNFHSIHDLATSSVSITDESKDDSKINASSSHSALNTSSFQSNEYSSFNEKLKAMSQMISNKENSQELISKTKRKPRTQITKQQKEILEYAYKMKCYPDSNEIEYLCNLLGFEENVIRIWFQNKRARNKNKN